MYTIDKRLSLMESFNEIVPGTLEGTKIYEKYANAFKILEGKKTLATFTNFINESLQHKDPSLINWANKAKDMISESCMEIWNFSLLIERYESLNESVYGGLIDNLKYLTTYDNETFITAVKNGALTEHLGFNDIREFNATINKISYAKKLDESNILFNPVSYIEVKGDDIIFMLESKVYRYNKTGGLYETQSPSQIFTNVNAAVQSAPYNVDTDEYDMTYLVGDVNITSKGKLLLDKQQIGIDELRQKIEKSIENEPYEKQIIESRKFDTMSLIVENWHKLTKFDNIHGLKNTVNGKFSYLIEHTNGEKYVIDNLGITKKYDTLHESLNDIKKYMNKDISYMFNEQLDKEANTISSINNINNIINEEIAKYDNQINLIREEMKFMNEGSDVYNESLELIELCEQGKSALLNKPLNESGGNNVLLRDKVLQYAVKYGNNKNDATKLISKNFDYVLHTYPNLSKSPSKIWDIISQL